MNCKEKLLEVRDIHKVYTKEGVPTKALNGITFDVLDGEFLGIIPDYTICLYPYRVYFESNNIRHLPCGDTVSFGDAVSWKMRQIAKNIGLCAGVTYSIHR